MVLRNYGSGKWSPNRPRILLLSEFHEFQLRQSIPTTDTYRNLNLYFKYSSTFKYHNTLTYPTYTKHQTQSNVNRSEYKYSNHLQHHISSYRVLPINQLPLPILPPNSNRSQYRRRIRVHPTTMFCLSLLPRIQTEDRAGECDYRCLARKGTAGIGVKL